LVEKTHMSAALGESRTALYSWRFVRNPFRGSVSHGYQDLQYSVLILLCSAAALTFYNILAGILDPEMKAPINWLAVGIESYLEWLSTLTPAAILMVIVGGLRTQRRVTRVVWLSIGVMCACLVGTILEDFLLHGADTAWILAHGRKVLADACVIALPAAFLVTIYEFHLRSLDVADAALKVQADQITMEAELNKARLRLLNAQIEPHFIFNSLAHVRRLYQIDPVKGHQMLASLIRYFENAFPSLRQETCSLKQEAALLDAYLNVHRMRMGSRLAYEVVFPASLLKLQIPTMVLLTLVENAIKHGLSPLPEGGYVRISALQTGDVLELSVTDSGRGITQCSGSGTGLANIRARLNTLYGGSAALRLTINQPRGITAAVCLPMRQLVA